MPRPRAAMKRTTAAAPCRRCVPDRVGDAHSCGAGANGGRVQRAQRLRIGARRVLGDVHDRQPFADRKGDGLFGQTQQLVERPPFGVLPQRTRSDERAALRSRAPSRCEISTIGLMSAMTVRAAQLALTASFCVTISRASRSTSRDDVRAGARQADVGGIDARVDR